MTLLSRISSISILKTPTSNLSTSTALSYRIGGGGHPRRRMDWRVKQRRNHIMTRKDYLQLHNQGREHNRVVCPCGETMILKYHICDVCYQATKHQTEKMLYEYREKTGNKFLVDDVKFEWKGEENVKSTRQKRDDGFMDREKERFVPEMQPDVVKNLNLNETVVKLEGKKPKGWFNVNLW